MSTNTNQSEAPQLPSNKPIMKDRYCFRITGAEMKLSGPGNKYISVKSELYAPDTIIHNSDGKRYGVAGRKLNMTVMIHNDKAKADYNEFLKRLDLSPEADFDNPNTEQLVGKCFSTQVQSKKYENRKDPTFEQLAVDPNAKGDVMIDPDTGLPEYGYSLDGGFGTDNVRKPTVAAISA